EGRLGAAVAAEVPTEPVESGRTWASTERTFSWGLNGCPLTVIWGDVIARTFPARSYETIHCPPRRSVYDCKMWPPYDSWRAATRSGSLMSVRSPLAS